VDWEWHLCGFPRPSDRFQETRRRRGPTTFGNKNVILVIVLIVAWALTNLHQLIDIAASPKIGGSVRRSLARAGKRRGQGTKDSGTG
jgi:hypothetical protein